MSTVQFEQESPFEAKIPRSAEWGDIKMSLWFLKLNI